MDNWKRIIWSDEASFEIGENVRQIRVLRKADEKYNQDCLAPSFKSGRSSVMIWGAIAYGFKSELVIMDRTRRTAEDFVLQAYEQGLRSLLSKVQDPILMEDGAPVHRSKFPKEWRERNNVEKLDWPAQSPDLNPIENVWMVMKDRLQKNNPPISSIDDMKTALQLCWDSLDVISINKYIETVPNRIKNVIKNKGKSTRW